jgi:3-deoxy-D-manno-octulosonic-acid transferase
MGEDLPEAVLLLTAPEDQPLPPLEDGIPIIHQLPPMASRGPVRRFIEHWGPDASVWIERVEDPLLLETAASAGIPLFLQDATAPQGTGPRARKAQRRLLGMFERILAVDTREADLIRGFGTFPARIEITGRLALVHQPPSCSDIERASLARAIGSRPVWLASCPPEEELEIILQAQIHACRSLHRLLLFIVPPLDTLGPAYADTLAGRGFSVARRDAGEGPTDGTEIFVADCLDEIGLYYRVAPVTFLGGTFAASQVPPPMEPATLGSAILSGPAFGRHSKDLTRLQRGGGCRVVRQPANLGTSVLDLMTPDKAALLALRAWDVASDGALVMDRLVSLVVGALRNRAF